jgi:hypothetical protein
VPATLTLTITDATGALAVQGSERVSRERFGESRTFEYRSELPLATLRPGPQVLAIDAVAGSERDRRVIPFRIR